MKKTKALISVAFLVLSTGCATAQPGSLGGLLHATQTVVTNEAPVQVITQKAEVMHDVATGVLTTNLVTVTNFETRTFFQTNLVWETAPVVKNTLDTVTAVAPVIPAPFGTFVTFGTGIASVLIGAAVRRKNAQNDSLSTQLTAVIHGVEDASKVLQDGKIKSAIADVAKKLDIADELNQSVQKITG